VAAPTSGNSSSLSTELQNREFGLIRHGGSHPHTRLGSYVAGCRCAEANKLNLGGRPATIGKGPYDRTLYHRTSDRRALVGEDHAKREVG
jgi:hypothetical protein